MKETLRELAAKQVFANQPKFKNNDNDQKIDGDSNLFMSELFFKITNNPKEIFQFLMGSQKHIFKAFEHEEWRNLFVKECLKIPEMKRAFFEFCLRKKETLDFMNKYPDISTLITRRAIYDLCCEDEKFALFILQAPEHRLKFLGKYDKEAIDVFHKQVEYSFHSTPESTDINMHTGAYLYQIALKHPSAAKYIVENLPTCLMPSYLDQLKKPEEEKYTNHTWHGY